MRRTIAVLFLCLVVAAAAALIQIKTDTLILPGSSIGAVYIGQSLWIARAITLTYGLELQHSAGGFCTAKQDAGYCIYEVLNVGGYKGRRVPGRVAAIGTDDPRFHTMKGTGPGERFGVALEEFGRPDVVEFGPFGLVWIEWRPAGVFAIIDAQVGGEIRALGVFPPKGGSI